MDAQEIKALSEAAGSATAGPSSDIKKLILGGGLGALLGGGASAYMASRNEDEEETSEERRKRIMQKALMGAAGGAGIGMIPGGISMMGTPDNQSVDRTSQSGVDRLINDEAGTLGSRISNAIGQWNPWNIIPGMGQDTGESKGWSAATSALAVPGGILGAWLPSSKGGISSKLNNQAFKDVASRLNGTSSYHDNLRKLLNSSNPNKGKILTELQKFRGPGQRTGLNALQHNLFGPSSNINNKNVNQAIAAWKAAGGDPGDIKNLLSNNSTLNAKYNRMGSILDRLGSGGVRSTGSGLWNSLKRRGGGGLAGFATPLLASYGLDQLKGDNGFSDAENFSDLKKYITAATLKKNPEKLKAYMSENGLSQEFFNRIGKMITDGHWSPHEVGAIKEQISKQ